MYKTQINSSLDLQSGSESVILPLLLLAVRNTRCSHQCTLYDVQSSACTGGSNSFQMSKLDNFCTQQRQEYFLLEHCMYVVCNSMISSFETLALVSVQMSIKAPSCVHFTPNMPFRQLLYHVSLWQKCSDTKDFFTLL